MPKVKISEYSATANSNTDVASINIDEGCAPSGINNAIRAVMGHLKDFQQGTNGDPFNGPHNGTVGATTPSTGAFTTLSATGTLSGGTSGTAYSFSGSAPATSLTLDASGNLGVGTTSPAFSNGKGIAILDGTTSRLKLATTATGSGATDGFELSCNGLEAYIYNYENSFMAFGTNNTERMRLDSSGNLLVGTTDSSGTIGAGFKVLGGRPVVVNAASTDGAATVYEAYSTGAAAYRFYVGLGGTIFATSAVITPITSDERLKQNIVDYSNGLSQVLGLRPRYFEYKKEPGRKMAGFISQEVQTVMPEAIVPTLEDPEMMTYSIDWYPLFVKAIQEQQSLITQLTARITALEGA